MPTRFRVTPAMRSQFRDMADNDNRTPVMMMRDARAMEAWAASRANEPAFAATAMEAVRQAQFTRRQFRPR